MGIRRKPEGTQMPRPTANPDPIASHYTRVSGTGEAANGAGKALWECRMRQTNQPKETTMTRMFTTAAVIALTISAAISAAQAGTSDQMASRIHDAAVAACAPERATGAMPKSHYGSIDEHCIYRVSRSAMDKY